MSWMGGFYGYQQQRAHRRRKGQCADRGQDHRHGERQRELFVELSGEAAEKSHRHEYRREHQRDRDHWPANVGDRRLGRLHRRHPSCIQSLLHGFHHYDRVVDHDADGKHQPEQRECVDGKAERRERAEGADERNRYDQDRNQRRAPALQEQVDDEYDQHKGHDQRLHHLFQRLGDERRRAVGNRVHHARRKVRCLCFHHLLDLLGDVERIGIGLQEDPDQRGGNVVFGTADRVVGGGELDAGDVPEAHHLAILGFPDDDVLELGGSGQTSLDEHRVLHLLALGGGRQAEAAGRRDDVLLAYDVGDVGGGDAQPGHALRVEPDTHAVVARAEDANLTDAGHPAQRVIQVEQGVVAQEHGVVAALRGCERNDLEKVGGGLAYGDAVTDNVRRKLALRDGNPVLDFDRIDVLVGADVEGHGQAVGAVVAALRAHVEHVLRAVDLLLDGGGDRLRYHVGIGAGKAGRHRDLRRNHLRILGNRKAHRRQHAHQDHEQSNDGREDRALDEEVEHDSTLAQPFFLGAAGGGPAPGWLSTGAASTAFTGAPGRSLPTPSVTTRSPAARPVSTTQSLPRR